MDRTSGVEMRFVQKLHLEPGPLGSIQEVLSVTSHILHRELVQLRWDASQYVVSSVTDARCDAAL